MQRLEVKILYYPNHSQFGSLLICQDLSDGILKAQLFNCFFIDHDGRFISREFGRKVAPLLDFQLKSFGIIVVCTNLMK